VRVVRGQSACMWVEVSNVRRHECDRGKRIVQRPSLYVDTYLTIRITNLEPIFRESASQVLLECAWINHPYGEGVAPNRAM